MILKSFNSNSLNALLKIIEEPTNSIFFPDKQQITTFIRYNKIKEYRV